MKTSMTPPARPEPAVADEMAVAGGWRAGHSPQDGHMAPTSALQALLSGVRRAPGRGRPGGGVRGGGGGGGTPPPLTSAAEQLPPQVDFFRRASGPGGGRKRARDGDGGERSLEEGVDEEEPGDEGEDEAAGGGEEAELESAMVRKLADALGGQTAVASGMVALGAGVLTAVQERAMALLSSGGEGEGEGEGEGPGRGPDVIAVAPTGSGKTLCYAAPMCACILRMREVAAAAEEKVKKRRGRKQSRGAAAGGGVGGGRAGGRAPAVLVLVPTRELAVQVGGVFSRLAHASRMRLAVTVLASKAALTGLGGANVDVVVATPARAVVATERRLVDFGAALRHVVLDEADRLLDDGFVAQVDAVLAACAPARRVHAFTATLPSAVEETLRGLARRPVKVVVGAGGYGGAAAVAEVARLVRQRFLFTGGKGEQGKVTAMRGMLRDGLAAPVLVFVQSKERAAELFRELIFDGVDVDAIHADRSGAARSAAIARFRAGRLALLIATDVLARGLDFRAVGTVVNYDMPTSAAAYIHRIGRTGRAGRRGAAVTFFTEEDAGLLHAVARVARAGGADVPDWMLAQKKLRRDEAARAEVRPPRRKRVAGPGYAALPARHRRAVVPRRRDFDDGAGGAGARGGDTDGDDAPGDGD